VDRENYLVVEESIKISNGLTIQGKAGGVRACFKLPDLED
jgi:hypothetical protein